jgi:integrase
VPPRSAAVGPEPWVPESFSVRKPTRKQSTDKRTGAKRTTWELRWFVDGVELRRRFERAGEAAEYALVLQDGFRAGWAYDGEERRFVSPEALERRRVVEEAPAPVVAVVEEAPGRPVTVLDWTATYWAEEWPTVEPSTRSELSRYLNPVRRWFVDVPPSAELAEAGDPYLKAGSLAVRPKALDDRALIGRAWLEAHSRVLADVGRDDLEAFLAASRVNRRYPDRQVSPATERRMVADLKQCWARAVERDLLPANPWDKVRLRTKRAGAARARTGRDALVADAELVLTPEQGVQLADACASRGSWGSVVRGYVLVMGLCGLRPSEGAGLVVGDLEVSADGPGWLTVRRSQRKVPERYLEDDEDPEWGPLKGRDLTDTRRVPVPTLVAAALRAHLAEHCVGAAPRDLVFSRRGKAFDLMAFGDDVWSPARHHLCPPVEGLDAQSPMQPKLSKLRRHDLRHSACSLWLRSGVDVTVCQRWSGHKRLSVFLDIYQGLIPGREEAGVAALEAALGTGSPS